MKKEVVTYINRGIPSPYNEWIKGRNGSVARHIAENLGLPYSGEHNADGVNLQERYYVPAKTIPETVARDLGIHSIEDLYGGVVVDSLHATKSVLHPTFTVKSLHPKNYSYQFASGVKDATLPGFTIFETESQDAIRAFYQLTQRGFSVRLKEPDNSDGVGQYVIKGEGDLLSRLTTYKSPEIYEKGIVLEANLHNATTISFGLTRLGGCEYTHIARQIDLKHNGWTQYGGAAIRIYKGGLENLQKYIPKDSGTGTALAQTIRVYEAYGELEPSLSRASFDVLQGYDNSGNFHSGVTDQTFRLGGSSPAEILAIRYLNQNPDLTFADALVTLDYNPQQIPEPNGEIFLDHPDLRITAKLL